MLDKQVLKRLDDLNGEIQTKISKLDSQMLIKLLDKTINELPMCFKLNNEILTILQDKKHFKTIGSLRSFVKDISGIKSSKKKRIEVELDFTRKLDIKGLTGTQITSKLPEISKKTSKSKRRRKTSQKKVKTVRDLSDHWINLNEKDLRLEFKQFQNSKDLKAAAGSLLKTDQRRLRKQSKIENCIIQNVMRRQALFHLGQ
ncbi:MAG: hypothetical protein ACXADY_15110 [Candidatus Hodarchaeales archaeon]|jgi:hypothetical protein